MGKKQSEVLSKEKLTELCEGLEKEIIFLKSINPLDICEEDRTQRVEEINNFLTGLTKLKQKTEKRLINLENENG